MTLPTRPPAGLGDHDHVAELVRAWIGRQPAAAAIQAFIAAFDDTAWWVEGDASLHEAERAAVQVGRAKNRRVTIRFAKR